jgi:hypothetical protein
MTLRTALFLALAVLGARSDSSPKCTQLSETVINGRLSIASGDFQAFRFTVTPSMRKPVFTGQYTTVEGGSLDINAYVLDSF